MAITAVGKAMKSSGDVAALLRQLVEQNAIIIDQNNNLISLQQQMLTQLQYQSQTMHEHRSY